MVSQNRNQNKRKKHPDSTIWSQYIGVGKTQNNTWRSNVSKKRKVFWCGSFPNELEAAEARDLLAVELYGEDARLNFPEDFVENHLKTIADRSIIPDGAKVHPQETLHIYREAAQVMGGTCLSPFYLESDTTLLFECKKGHRFHMSPADITDGKWCTACSHRNPVYALTIEGHRYAAELNNGELLSTKADGGNAEKLLWKCVKGHVFEKTVHAVRLGGWCAECWEHLLATGSPLSPKNRAANKPAKSQIFCRLGG